MRCCDKRYKMRLPSPEKEAAETVARGLGITVSDYLRRALRAYVGLREPQAIQVLHQRMIDAD